MLDDLERFEILTDEVNRLIARVQSLHTPSFDFGTGIPLYRSEIHTIDIVGKNPGINVTRLSERIGVTKGAVSQMLTRLAKKKLIEKKAVSGNEKERMIELTGLGRIAYENHRTLHRYIFTFLQNHYGTALPSRLERFQEVVDELSKILSTVEGHKDTV